MDRKKEANSILIISIVLFILIAPQFINSELFDDFKDAFNSIAGFVVLDTTNASVNIASVTPVIANGDVVVPATQTISENGFINVSFQFNATDADGAGDLDNVSASGYINRTTETVSYNLTCQDIGNVNTTTNRYNCTVELWWFAGNGDWTVNVSINDSDGNYVENVVNVFSVAATKGMQMDPQAMSWTSINLGDTNKLASDNLTINNTANVDLSNINVTAYNLHGRDTTTQFIYAGNFSGNDANACEGEAFSNNTQVQITGVSANHGNHTPDDGTAQEEVVFCLEAIEGAGGSLSVQNYDTSNSIDWDIRVD